MRYFSMFSGIGCFEYAFPKSWKCVGFSEINHPAIAIYRYYYPDHINYGNAKKIKAEALPDFELLCGGFPCQTFSIAGKRKGFNDTRGTLFFDIERIIKAKRPRYILLENVAGLLSHDSGRTYKIILSAITALGYDVQSMVLNSKYFGVAQNRERVFIIGHIGKRCSKKILPFISNSKQNIAVQRETSNTITAHEAHRKAGGGAGCYIAESKQPPDMIIADFRADEGLRIRKDNISPCLQAGITNTKQTSTPLVIHNMFPRSSKSGKGGTGHLTNKNNVAYALNTGHVNAVETNMSIRTLTEIECERLQGLPDNYTQFSDYSNNNLDLFGGRKIHKTRSKIRYETLGNGITVNVPKFIIENLL